MRISRRLLVQCVAVAGAPLTHMARANTLFPSKPVRIVVAYAPGGLVDTLARAVGAQASQSLGQPVIIENRPGAGGNIAAEYVARSPADGYTLLATLGYGLPAASVLYPRLGFDPRHGLASISEIVYSPGIIVVHPSLPVHSFQALVEHARRNPRSLRIGSWASGSTPHMIQAYMSDQLEAPVLHVPYKGEAPVVAELLGGQINMAYLSAMTARPHIQAGTVRPLAVFGRQRNRLFPEVVTMAEAGFTQPIFALEPPTGLFAPQGIEAPLLQVLGQAFSQAVQTPSVLSFIEASGSQPVGNLPAQAQARFDAYYSVIQQMTAATGTGLR